MGAKGDKASKCPQAERLYADGNGLAEISRLLDVSETTLRRWKADSAVPGEEMDGWDKLRAQRRGNIQRLRDLFEEQLEYLEGLRPQERTAPMMDTISKLGALVERWDRVESETRRRALEEAANVVEETARQQGQSETDAQFWREKVLGITNR